MRAWVVSKPGPIGTGPPRPVERPEPEPGPGATSFAVGDRVGGAWLAGTDLAVAGIYLTDTHPSDQAEQALADLAADRFTGAAVISM